MGSWQGDFNKKGNPVWKKWCEKVNSDILVLKMKKRMILRVLPSTQYTDRIHFTQEKKNFSHEYIILTSKIFAAWQFLIILIVLPTNKLTEMRCSLEFVIKVSETASYTCKCENWKCFHTMQKESMHFVIYFAFRRQNSDT